MPYIPQAQRNQLDGPIAVLADAVKAIIIMEGRDTGDVAGLLNYTYTSLLLRTLPARRYWAIALVTGVLHNVLDEFYRRYGAPYEDEKRVENGDVYTTEDQT